MTTPLSTLAAAASWRVLGGLSNAAFRESDIVFDSVTGNYYLFSTGSYVTTGGQQGQVDMYVASTPEGLSGATPVRLAPTGTGVNSAGVYPSVVIDPADGAWHLYAENFSNGVIRHFKSAAAPTINSFALQTGGTLNFQVIDTSVRKPAGGDVDATVTGALGATGSQSVIPAGGTGLTNIAVGSYLVCVNANGTSQELVKVTGIDTGAGTFTAPFTLTHTAGWIVRNAWLAVGIASFGSPQPLYLVYADGPQGKRTASHTGLWYPITSASGFGADATSGVFTGGAIGLPAWATYAIYDPNLALTSDGRVWVLFSGLSDATTLNYQVGIVEIDMATGWALTDPVQLPNPRPRWNTTGQGLSDLSYVPSPGGVTPDRIFGFTNDNFGAGPGTHGDYGWGCLDLAVAYNSGQPGMYGEGYPGSAVPPGGSYPVSVRVQIACGTAGAFVDVSSSIDRFSYKQRKDESTGTIVADFDIDAFNGLIGGVAYDIRPNQEVRVDCPYEADQTRAYMRPFYGYVMIPGDSPEGAEKKYHLTCSSVNRDLQFPTKQIVTQYPPGDGTPVVTASPITAIAAGGANQPFTVLSATSLINMYAPYTDVHGNAIGGRRMIAQNWDGTNREVITVISINRGALTVNADFVSSKSLQTPPGGGAPSWSLSGGISGADLWRDGWSTVDVAGTRTEYESIIDHYYNYAGRSTVAAAIATTGIPVVVTPASMEFIINGRAITVANADNSHSESVVASACTATTFTITNTSTKSAGWTTLVPVANLAVDKGAIHETLLSLIHTKYAGTTPLKAFQQMVEQNPGPAQYRHTVTASLAAGVRTVTPDSMTGLEAGAFIYCGNADGTNVEQVMIRTTPSASTFTANFIYPKSGTGTTPWVINTGVAPVIHMGWTKDNPAHNAPWTRQVAIYDLYDVSIQTPVSLTDATVIDPAAQAHYDTGVHHTLDGTNQISWQDVLGNSELAAAGSYEDVTATGSIGRIIAGEPMLRSELQTNAECATAGQGNVSLFGKPRDTIQQVKTHSLIDINLWLQASSVLYKNALGQYAVYAVADRELNYAEGVAAYLFTLGDRLPLLGDKAPPAYGSQVTGALQRPSPPRWVGAADPTGWVLSNTYDSGTGLSTMQVQATLGGELNLRRVGFEYNTGGGWSAIQYVVVSGGTTSANFTSPPFTPGITVQWRATAWDNLNPPHASDPSSTGTVVASPVVPPQPATDLGGGPGTFNPASRRTDLTITFTASVSPNVVRYKAVVNDGHPRVVEGITGTSFTTDVLPGVSVSIYMVAIDRASQESGHSTPTYTFNSASVVRPLPPTMTSEASNHYNGQTLLVDVGENYTEDTQPAGIMVDHYEALVTPAGGWTRFYNFAHVGIGVALFDGLDPGVVCDAYMYAVDTSGTYSLPSTLRQFTTVSSPTNDKLKNPNFATSKYADHTQPDYWTKTLSTVPPGAAGQLDTSVIIEGPNTCKLSQTGSDGNYVEFLSDPVNVWLPSNASLSALYGLYALVAVSAADVKGLLTISVVFYNAASTLVGTPKIVYSGPTQIDASPPTVTKYTKTYNPNHDPPDFPANTSYARLKIRLEGNSLGSSSIYVGGCRLESKVIASADVLGSVRQTLSNDGLLDLATLVKWGV